VIEMKWAFASFKDMRLSHDVLEYKRSQSLKNAAAVNIIFTRLPKSSICDGGKVV
jgi:hypothetical protein